MRTAGSGPESPSTSIFATLPVTPSGHPGNLGLVDCWLDERGPWCDLVGVFQKSGSFTRLMTPPELKKWLNSDPSAEVTAGQESYLDVLGRIHKLLEPSLYVEIGVFKGRSLRLCNCDAIGVDPDPKLGQRSEKLSLYSCTSDNFFFFHAKKAIKKPIDLAFIDGMHLAEYVYRDFMSLEKLMNPKGVIVVDDVLPNHPLQATRARQTRAWCGDVWRFVRLLSEVRPDLKLTWLDTAPTGLLVVRRLEPANRTLWKHYNPLVRRLRDGATETLPQSLIKREMAIAPTEGSIKAAIGL